MNEREEENSQMVAHGRQRLASAIPRAVVGPTANPVSERWRDLLLAAQRALEALRGAGIATAKTRVFDDTQQGRQRLLEVECFDRAAPPNALGRRALISLAAPDAEFVDDGRSAWPAFAAQLAANGQRQPGSRREHRTTLGFRAP